MEAPKKVLVRTDLGKNSTHVINTVKKKKSDLLASRCSLLKALHQFKSPH